MGKLIDADAAIESLTEYGNGRAVHINVEEAVRRIEQLPSAQPDTTTHDSIPVETGKNDGDKTSDDCISRAQAIDALKSRKTAEQSSAGIMRNAVVDFCIGIVKKLPSVQPERKTGRWIPDGSELGIKCNKCGKSFSDYVNAGTGYMFLEETPNFCPNCGADMRGEQNDN